MRSVTVQLAPTNWTASSGFGTYRLCEQRRFRWACASAQSRQNLSCSLIQAVSQEEPSDRKPDPWPLWMAGHAQLKFVMTECLTRPILCHSRGSNQWVWNEADIVPLTTVRVLSFWTDRSWINSAHPDQTAWFAIQSTSFGCITLSHFVKILGWLQQFFPVSKFLGWMDELGFYVPSTVFQSFQDDGRVNMKGSVQWSAI